jgi:O-antigen ligase
MVFSAGFFCLLTGMVWVSDRGLYSRLFYWTIALPAVFSAAASPRESAGLLKSRIFLMYLLFACYTVITLFWSESDDDVLGLIKRPFFVALAFLAVFEFGRRCHALLMATVKWSAVFSVFMALYILYFFFAVGGQGRLQGDGALSNPLLISHVFGFFLALWLGYYFSKRKLIEPLFFFVFAVLIGLLFATGSRTPLLATVFTVTWLTILAANHRKSIVVICTTLVLASMILLFSPEAITQRGLSYRPEIWMDVIRQILAEPWFGHGFGTPLQVWVEDLNQAFSDPHNLTLSVLYSGGIIGGALWIAVYFTALWEAWRWRHDRWVFAFSATVVYGLAAGLSEGGSFFSRPKEHWSLIWIPLVLLSYAAFRASTNERGE